MQNSKDNLDSQTNPFPSYQALSKNYDEIWYNQSNNQVQIKNQNDKFLSDKWMALIIIILVPSLGLVLGVIVPPSENLPFPYDKISSIIGWTYFSAWSISFYPQVYTNFMRKSVVGLSLDFNLLNMLGFACYSCFNCVIFWDAGVQKQYLVTHPGGSVGVQINDIFFALHAFTICGIILIQCLIYDRGNQGFSKIALVACGIFVVGASIWSLLIYFTSNQNNISQQYLVLLYVLSSVKLVVSLIKFIPQVWLNYCRKSTVGWSIGNVLLDFTGGGFSFCQIVLDSAIENDWNNFVGNPVKFGLGLISIFFDVIFMLQHYVFYRSSSQQQLLSVCDENYDNDSSNGQII